jgi:cytoskeletal protein RodZ
MRRQGGGFGFVLMLVVLVVIFFLAMNNFKSVAPTAAAIQKHNNARKNGEEVLAEDAKPQSASASADSWTPAPPSRPNLETMDQNTSNHSAAVQDALSQAN